MPVSFRLKPHEQEKLRTKNSKFNKFLAQKGLEPKKDSELLHELFALAIDLVEVSENGQIHLNKNSQLRNKI